MANFLWLFDDLFLCNEQSFIVIGGLLKIEKICICIAIELMSNGNGLIYTNDIQFAHNKNPWGQGMILKLGDKPINPKNN